MTAARLADTVGVKPLVTAVLLALATVTAQAQSNRNFYPSGNLLSLQGGVGAQDKIGGSTYPRRFGNAQVAAAWTKLLPTGRALGAQGGWVSSAKGEPGRTDTSGPFVQLEGGKVFTNEDNSRLVIPGLQGGAQYATEVDGSKQVILAGGPSVKVIGFVGDQVYMMLSAEADVGTGFGDKERHASLT